MQATPNTSVVLHPHAKQVFMCNYVTGSAGMTCRDIGADKQYYVVLIVAQCCYRDMSKDVGMGLCRLTLCCLLAVWHFIPLNCFEIFFIDLNFY